MSWFIMWCNSFDADREWGLRAKFREARVVESLLSRKCTPQCVVIHFKRGTASESLIYANLLNIVQLILTSNVAILLYLDVLPTAPHIPYKSPQVEETIIEDGTATRQQLFDFYCNMAEVTNLADRVGI